jgi:hypothetical protein
MLIQMFIRPDSIGARFCFPTAPRRLLQQYLPQPDIHHAPTRTGLPGAIVSASASVMPFVGDREVESRGKVVRRVIISSICAGLLHPLHRRPLVAQVENRLARRICALARSALGPPAKLPADKQLRNAISDARAAHHHRVCLYLIRCGRLGLKEEMPSLYHPIPGRRA